VQWRYKGQDVLQLAYGFETVHAYVVSNLRRGGVSVRLASRPSWWSVCEVGETSTALEYV